MILELRTCPCAHGRLAAPQAHFPRRVPGRFPAASFPTP
jgi:hypothetical protein